MTSSFPRPASFYHGLPKVDLHRHLEGSLRLRTMVEIGHSYGLDLPGAGELRQLVQVGENEPFTFINFLSKFQTLRRFFRSPEIIQRITYEAIADAAADNVRYLELRFTPFALARAENYPLGEVIDWVIQAASTASAELGIKTRLIVSVNRHESTDLAAEVVRLACERIAGGIVGLDLAGNEADFSALLFAGVVQEAQHAGLNLTLHAGEWGPASNVSEAICQLGAQRIGHGVRVLEDPRVTALALERQVPFEVCITSNYQSGVIPTAQAHPLARMHSLGLNVTLNTDDPSISQITLSNEYFRAVEELGLSLGQLKDCVLAAAQAAFLPEDEKTILVEELQAAFPEK